MNLTNEQYNFFKDLDVSEAVKHSVGKIHFTFPYNGRVVEVQTYRRWNADILVHSEQETGGEILVDRSLSLFDIPESENISGQELLKQLYEVVHNRPAFLFREAWMNTPYVKEWSVDVLGSRIRFSFQDGPVGYELCAHESPEFKATTTVELLVDGERVHTFLLPMGYHRRPTAQFVYWLSNAITVAWRDEVGK